MFYLTLNYLLHTITSYMKIRKKIKILVCIFYYNSLYSLAQLLFIICIKRNTYYYLYKVYSFLFKTNNV